MSKRESTADASSDSTTEGAPAQPAARPRVNVEDVMGEHREIVLLHGSVEYVLRVTSNGRLILTK